MDARLVTGPLPEPPPERRQLDLSELERWVIDPSAAFCRERFGISFWEREQGLDEVEPFAADGLDRYALYTAAATALLDGAADQQVAATLRAGGRLPYGGWGDRLLVDGMAIAQDLVRRIAPRRAVDAAAIEVDLRLAAGHLRGWLPRAATGTQVHWRGGSLRGRDRLRAWVAHLALCAALPPDSDPRTCFVATDLSLELTPVAEPLPLLEQWLEARWQGLMLPPPLFPDTAVAWARSFWKDGDEDKAMKAARGAWLPGWNGRRGESEGACIRLLYRAQDPLGEDFTDLARRLVLPMLAYGTETKGTKE